MATGAEISSAGSGSSRPAGTDGHSTAALDGSGASTSGGGERSQAGEGHAGPVAGVSIGPSGVTGSRPTRRGQSGGGSATGSGGAPAPASQDPVVLLGALWNTLTPAQRAALLADLTARVSGVLSGSSASGPAVGQVYAPLGGQGNVVAAGAAVNASGPPANPPANPPLQGAGGPPLAPPANPPVRGAGVPPMAPPANPPMPGTRGIPVVLPANPVTPVAPVNTAAATLICVDHTGTLFDDRHVAPQALVDRLAANHHLPLTMCTTAAIRAVNTGLRTLEFKKYWDHRGQKRELVKDDDWPAEVMLSREDWRDAWRNFLALLSRGAHPDTVSLFQAHFDWLCVRDEFNTDFESVLAFDIRVRHTFFEGSRRFFVVGGAFYLEEFKND